MIHLLFVIAAIGFVLVVVRRLKLGWLGGPKFKAKAEVLRARDEQILYHRLVQALPEKVILAQVSFSAFLEIEGASREEYWRRRGQISQKFCDFLVCGKGFNPEVVIELDGYSHRNKQEKDGARDAILHEAGLRTMRWDSRQIPNATDIRKALGIL